MDEPEFIGFIEKISAFMKDEGSDYAHPTAAVDEGCKIGLGTKIRHFSNIMPNCTFGQEGHIRQIVVISPEVIPEKNVNVQNNVSAYAGVQCDDVILAYAVFANIINPPSAIDRKDQNVRTVVKKGASIAAVFGYDIGQFAFMKKGLHWKIIL